MFVKMIDSTTWHWCTSCPQYPLGKTERCETLPADARRCRTCLDSSRAGRCADAGQDTAKTRRFLTHEERVALESNLRATNWLSPEDARIVKEDMLAKWEHEYAAQGSLPKDIEELRELVRRNLV